MLEILKYVNVHYKFQNDEERGAPYGGLTSQTFYQAYQCPGLQQITTTVVAHSDRKLFSHNSGI